MVNYWVPGTKYGDGDVVEYEKHLYKIIQPHRSQGDWPPSKTPALWGRCSGNEANQHRDSHTNDHCERGEHHSGCGHPQGGNQQQQHQQPQQPPPPQQQNSSGGGGDKKWDEHHDQKVDIHDEEREKSWYDLDPERKKQLEVGGGLAVGAALLGGGFLAWKSHNKSEEEKKAQVWALQNWVSDAQRRTQQFYQNGASGPYTWVLTQGMKFPQGAFQGGEENGNPMYIARCYYEGGIHIGKAAAHFGKGAVIGYDGKEVELEQYEILLANPQAVRWVDSYGAVQVNNLGARPVEGGRENDGTPILIAQAPYKGGTHPGKITSKCNEGAVIVYGNDEKVVKQYRVLVQN